MVLTPATGSGHRGHWWHGGFAALQDHDPEGRFHNGHLLLFFLWVNSAIGGAPTTSQSISPPLPGPYWA